jgi:hypothetical protein
MPPTRTSHRDRDSGYQERYSGRQDKYYNYRDTYCNSPYLQQQDPYEVRRLRELLRCGSEVSRRSSVTSNIGKRRRSSGIEIHDYLTQLGHKAGERRLSQDLQQPAVVADRRRREFHRGEESARQFDMTLPYVLDMLHYMYERYDTVSCYSMGLLEAGMIIYYLEPYTLGLDQRDQGCGTAVVGENRYRARVHLKGRFGIIVNKYSHSLKVAQVYSFGDKGLESKNPKMWDEYVGVRDVDAPDFHTVSKKAPLEVRHSCCEILPTSSAHLVTSKISLSNQILCAGRITTDSLERLRVMVKEVDDC